MTSKAHPAKREDYQARLDTIDLTVKKLPQAWQVPLVLGIFIGARGKVWKDSRGYHARAYATSPSSLQPLLTVLGGRTWSLARGKVVWNLSGKESITWLHRQISRLVPDLTQPLPEPSKRGRKPKACKHCGGVSGRHEKECYDYVDSE